MCADAEVAGAFPGGPKTHLRADAPQPAQPLGLLLPPCHGPGHKIPVMEAREPPAHATLHLDGADGYEAQVLAHAFAAPGGLGEGSDWAG